MFDEFIKTPVSQNIKSVCSVMNEYQSIAVYPSIEYILNSLYLQVTGSIEQKLLLIAWQTATNNNKLRYNIFKGNQKCVSSLADKNKLYCSLIREIRANSIPKYNPYTIPSKDLFNKAKGSIDTIIKYHPLCDCFSKNIAEYCNVSQKIQNHIEDLTCENIQKNASDFFEEISSSTTPKKQKNNDKKELLGFKNDLLKSIYNDFIYQKRNTLAHNTIKIPQLTIPELFDSRVRFDNIFIHLLILTYIDNIFIHLYKDYKESIA